MKQTQITKDSKFKTGSGQVVSFNQMADRIINWIKADPERDYVLAIGTDSQSYDEAKVVLAITLHKVGCGGIFFIKTMFNPPFKKSQLHEKLYLETQTSLTATELLIESLLEENFDILDNKNVHLKVHVDIGKNGSTKAYISELEGWVKAMGYDVEIKPNSYAASFVADKYSK